MSEPKPPMLERRPLAARGLPVFQRLATRLARWGASPNAISVAGLVCGLLAGAALAATALLPSWEQRLLWVAAALLIQLRLLANLLDGMVAVETGRVSPMGELFNEIPDRISDSAILIGAGYAAAGDIALGYGAACVALFTAYLRALGKAAGAPQEFCGPMAKQQRMALVTALSLFCALAPRDWQFPWGGDGYGILAVGLIVIIVGGLLTAWRRLARIARNLRKSPS
jgi:phosphatidylglycerophosphate synthase